MRCQDEAAKVSLSFGHVYNNSNKTIDTCPCSEYDWAIKTGGDDEA
jgi:hypothetical protein